ncbi:protein MICROTUBULE BINDING PROTEIN 2C-like [Durio zibethinus]|uniref:Protein MICROTUBULE BINDING PROTEIN 2C-like n=1 Tax=Durio zibethinus TaxID=66656 RepID=A0A6P5Y7Z5_DURZI|nr:protein MICROTUBULE BINDING PROTEIN 2C-like [Durio zibethinus]
MFEPHHFVDLQDNSDLDSKSWLSGDISNSSPIHHRTQSSLNHSNGNVDRVLYNDLVEMIPLVQSLIERKANSSFTRRGSIIYTKTPSRESLSRKATDLKGRNAAQSIPVRKKKDQVDQSDGNNQDGDNYSIFSSRALSSEKENEELIALREQLDDLQRKLLEKDELLKSSEISKNVINDLHAELDKLHRYLGERDSLVKSIQMQLSDAKIKLADKQAALEKTQWEAMTSKQKVEKLQNDIDSMQGEFSSFMVLLNGLTKNNPTTRAEDYDVAPCHLDHLPYIDDLDDKEMQNMEEVRQAYVAALATAKEKQDEESLAAAASARLHLQSFLFKSEDLEESNFDRGRDRG